MAVAAADIGASGHLRVGPVQVDALAPLGGVLLREQPVNRDRVEVRIANVVVAIRERRLEHLGDQVQVLRRVVPEALHVVAVQDIQGNRQRRPL